MDAPGAQAPAECWQTPGWYLRLALLLFALALWPAPYARRSFPFEDERLGLALPLALVLAVAFDVTRPGSTHLPAPARALVALVLLALQVAATRWGALSGQDAIHWVRTRTYIVYFGDGPGLRWLVAGGCALLAHRRAMPH